MIFALVVPCPISFPYPSPNKQGTAGHRGVSYVLNDHLFSTDVLHIRFNSLLQLLCYYLAPQEILETGHRWKQQVQEAARSGHAIALNKVEQWIADADRLPFNFQEVRHNGLPRTLLSGIPFEVIFLE